MNGNEQKVMSTEEMRRKYENRLKNTINPLIRAQKKSAKLDIYYGDESELLRDAKFLNRYEGQKIVVKDVLKDLSKDLSFLDFMEICYLENKYLETLLEKYMSERKMLDEVIEDLKEILQKE